MLTAIGSPVETDLENALSAALGQAPSKAGAQRILRVLELLAEVSALRSCVRFQNELLAYPHSDVRSQATVVSPTRDDAGRDPIWLAVFLEPGSSGFAEATADRAPPATMAAFRLLRNATRSRAICSATSESNNQRAMCQCPFPAMV